VTLYQWVDCDRDTVSKRYDRIAAFIPFFDRLFFLPHDLRSKAVARLGLSPGDAVLEVGCGTGVNLPHLYDAVGPAGRIYGVDISPGMLRKARQRHHEHGWRNVDLSECDAADYTAPTLLDGVLFSLSYNTMPHHRAVLRKTWDRLLPGGRLVIMDAKVPPGPSGKLVLPFSLWLMKHTMLGNPLIHPWKELAALTGDIDMTQRLFRSYYICCGVKPVQAPSEAANSDERDAAYRIAAE